MRVRLAFAVAAHLEPDILVVDEVLAVGDAEFQKKAIGKMKDISGNDGRTVLFVSHNMAAVKSLCTRGIVLENGTSVFEGTAEESVDFYLENNQFDENSEITINNDNKSFLNNNFIKVNRVYFVNHNNQKIKQSNINEDCFLKIEYEVLKDDLILNLSLSIYSKNEEYVLSSPSGTDNWFKKNHPLGEYISTCKLEKNFFNESSYNFTLLFVENGTRVIHQLDNIVSLNFYDDDENRHGYFGKWNGLVRPILQWGTEKE
jgi:lipopolysaccharide transport system ATP-binding protein